MANKEFVCFSLGENCLTDNILDRNGLKSFSSPFSSGRSNIEYILGFEKQGYTDFIDKNFLEYQYLGDGKKVVRNNKYVVTRNIYNGSCALGFEFTHHDVIADERARQAFERRYQRILSLTNNNIILVYHHRKCDQTDTGLMLYHLTELADIYKSRQNNVAIFAFYQVIVSDKTERKVESYRVGDVHMYKFYTLDEWSGNNNDIFWARCDDDLVQIMIDDIKQTKQQMENEN